MDDFRLGKEIKHINQTLRNYFAEKYADMLPDGLNGYEGAVIGFLYERQNEEVGLNDIAAFFHVNKSSASEMLSKLAKAGFISIAPLKMDKRRNVISLTKKGLTHRENAKKVFDAFEADVSKCLSQQEKENLKSILNKINGSIGGKSNV